MLKEFRADLHIHTCISPCAEVAMLPEAIIRQAKEKKIDIVGICDHNSSANVLAVQDAGKKESIEVFGGMEITSAEEAHITVFFEDSCALKKMQGIVSANLILSSDKKNLGLPAPATTLTVDKIVSTAKSLGGLVIAAHIDRQAFGIISQLGFVPKGLQFDALELSANYHPDKLVEYKSYGFALVTFSDAHFLEDIGKVSTRFFLEKPTFIELKTALLDNERFIPAYS